MNVGGIFLLSANLNHATNFLSLRKWGKKRKVFIFCATNVNFLFVLENFQDQPLV